MKFLDEKHVVNYLLIATFAVFTIGYFVVTNKVSYALPTDSVNYLYNNRIMLITNASKLYAQDTKDFFKDKDTVYITVDDLVKAKYYPADDQEGNVRNPNNDLKVLNDIKIRLTKAGNNVDVKVLDN